MKSLSEQLSTISKQPIAQEVSDSSNRYGMFNTGSVECEVGEFLYGLVRVMKPERVLETGTHLGWAAGYIGMGLRHNQMGHLDTIEYDEGYTKASRVLLEKLGVREWATVFHANSLDFNAQHMYDIILSDTEPHLRFKELLRFEKNLGKGGILLIHDLHGGMCQVDNKELGFGWPFGRLPKEIVELVRTDSLRPFHFNTPRGLTCFYRPREEDFKFYG